MSTFNKEWQEEFDRIVNSSSPRRSRMEIKAEVDEIMRKRKSQEFRKSGGYDYGKYSDSCKPIFTAAIFN